jgi:uncharacterized protein (DUF697 family)/GTP-binding protein EngB required for normal cell division
MKRFAATLYEHVINPPADAALTRVRELPATELPTIWLLGKTGAGKSSIVQKLTGESRAAIGNGFMPCTRQSSYFNYPAEHSIVRFLDTRGLGEAGYDAERDIEALGSSRHAIMVVMRIRDSEQNAVLAGLRQIQQAVASIQHHPLMLVHTGADELTNPADRERATAAHQQAVETAWGAPVACCSVDFGMAEDGANLRDTGLEALQALVSERVPELQLWLVKRQQQDAERGNFDRLRSEILWYAGTAAAVDALPVVGLVSVPAIQGKMLHSLARKYAIDWDRKAFTEFTAALGGGAALRYGASLLGRQVGKLVPGYGQLPGTAMAVVASYAGTYALGRAACSYFYYRQHGITDLEGATRTRYRDAMAEGIVAGKRTFLRGRD